MNKLVLLLISFFVFSACGGDDKLEQKKLDPFTQLHVNIKSKLSTRSDYSAQHLSPEELLRQAVGFQYYAVGFETVGTRSIGDNEKDFEKLIIKMWGTDIINHDTIATYWRDARDLIIIAGMGDTIGYIPQKVRNEAFGKIFEAEKEGNYDLIYKLFQDAFVAVPCTPQEYEELKAKGLN